MDGSMNINKIKQQITEILDSLPLGIQYRYLQAHLMSCLSEINKLEKQQNKKVKKEVPITEKKIFFSQNALDEIENLIKEYK